MAKKGKKDTKLPKNRNAKPKNTHKGTATGVQNDDQTTDLKAKKPGPGTAIATSTSNEPAPYKEPQIMAWDAPKQDNLYLVSDDAAAQDAYKKGNVSYAKQKSRDSARGQACTSHPWRSAYAICAYCGRPFCYQDIMELKDAYYCIEDAEALPLEHIKKTEKLGHRSLILAGILIILSAFGFFYFSFGNVSSIIGFLASAGPKALSLQISNSDVLVLLDTIFMLLGILSSLAIFAWSRKGAYVALFSCLCLTVLFTYKLITYPQLHTALIGAAIFISTILLIYYGLENMNANRRLKSEKATAKENLERWPGAGRF